MLIALLAAAFLIDRLIAARTEASVASQISSGVAQVDGDVDVTIHGFPFLTQYAQGSFGQVDARIDSYTHSGVELTDIRATGWGVPADISRPVERVVVDATLPLDSLRTALAQVLPSQADIAVELDGDLVALRTEIFSLALELRLEPRPAGAALAIDVESISLAGMSVSADDLPFGLASLVQDLTLPVSALPEGVEVTGLEILDDAVALRAEGSGVVLELP